MRLSNKGSTLSGVYHARKPRTARGDNDDSGWQQGIER